MWFLDFDILETSKENYGIYHSCPLCSFAFAKECAK